MQDIDDAYPGLLVLKCVKQRILTQNSDSKNKVVIQQIFFSFISRIILSVCVISTRLSAIVWVEH